LAPAVANGPGGLTPPAVALGPGAHKALKFQVTVESIEKGTIADFKNVDLNAKQKKMTTYYVKVMVKAAGNDRQVVRELRRLPAAGRRVDPER